MGMALHKIIQLLQNKKVILGVFFSAMCLKYLILLFSAHESNKTRIVSLAALVFYGVLSIYSYKNSAIASLILSFLVLFSGLGALIGSVFLIGLDELVLKLSVFSIGVYFCYGGIRIFKTRKGEM